MHNCLPINNTVQHIFNGKTYIFNDKTYLLIFNTFVTFGIPYPLLRKSNYTNCSDYKKKHAEIKAVVGIILLTALSFKKKLLLYQKVVNMFRLFKLVGRS